MTENSKDTASSGPELPSMFWAAACASALPMTLGLIGLFIYFTSLGPRGAIYNDPIFGLPVWLCFTLGTPLVAWLSCRALVTRAQTNKQSPIAFLEVWPTALKFSFFVHALGFLTTVTIFSFSSVEDAAGLFTMSLVMGGFINIGLFVFVTLPLSLFCSAIFAMVYSAPETTSAS